MIAFLHPLTCTFAAYLPSLKVCEIQTRALAALITMCPSPEMERWRGDVEGAAGEKSFVRAIGEMDVRAMVGEEGEEAMSTRGGDVVVLLLYFVFEIVHFFNILRYFSFNL